MKLLLNAFLFLGSTIPILSQNSVDVKIHRSEAFGMLIQDNSDFSEAPNLRPFLIELNKTDSIQLYRNGKPYQKLAYRPDLMLDVPNGDYVFEYQSFYGLQRSNALMVREKDVKFYSVSIFLDRLSQNQSTETPPLFHQLEEGDSLLIIHLETVYHPTNEQVGHIMEIPDTIVVFKRKNSYWGHHKSISRKLTNKECDYLKEYLLKMEYLDIPVALTDEVFGTNILCLNEHKIIRHEAKFQWLGFELLKKQLNL